MASGLAILPRGTESVSEEELHVAERRIAQHPGYEEHLDPRVLKRSIGSVFVEQGCATRQLQTAHGAHKPGKVQ